MSPRGFRNWSPREVEKFLREQGFIFDHQRGSHAYFYHPRLKAKVCVPEYHHELPPKTLKSVIRQSAISDKTRLDWLRGC